MIKPEPKPTGGPDMVENRLRRVRDVTRGLLEKQSVTSRFDGSVRHIYPNSVSGRQGGVLRDWVGRTGASSTVETGLGYGLSMLFICEGLLEQGGSHARHVALDPYQAANGNIGLQIIDQAGLGGLVEFHAEESQLALPRFVSEGRSFDFAFVDGNHRFEGVFLDLIFLGRLLGRGGVVLVDDLQLASVTRATRFCVSNLGWTLEETSTEDEYHHWAVLRTPRDSIERPFDHYVDF